MTTLRDRIAFLLRCEAPPPTRGRGSRGGRGAPARVASPPMASHPGRVELRLRAALTDAAALFSIREVLQTALVEMAVPVDTRLYYDIVDTLLDFALEKKDREGWSALVALVPPPRMRTQYTVRQLFNAAEAHPDLALATVPLLADFFNRVVDDGNDVVTAVAVGDVLRSPVLGTARGLEPALEHAIDITSWDALLRFARLDALPEELRARALAYFGRKARFEASEGPTDPSLRAVYERDIAPAARFAGREPWLAAITGTLKRLDEQEAKEAEDAEVAAQSAGYTGEKRQRT